MMKPITGVLFDLDGTLLDTAPDLIFSINQLREQFDLPALSANVLRPLIGGGSKGMIKYALGFEETHPEFNIVREQFLDLYQAHLADATQFFPHMEQVLIFLEEQNIPWGIVTNKLTRHTLLLLKALNLEHRPQCIICGDTLPKYKPDPEPIIHACQLLQLQPQHCLYIGDSQTDVLASKAAGTLSLVALYGYISIEEDPYTWQAHGYVKDPLEIMHWLGT